MRTPPRVPTSALIIATSTATVRLPRAGSLTGTSTSAFGEGATFGRSVSEGGNRFLIRGQQGSRSYSSPGERSTTGSPDPPSFNSQMTSGMYLLPQREVVLPPAVPLGMGTFSLASEPSARRKLLSESPSSTTKFER